MKINQPKFKTKKPIGLTLDYLESQQPQKEILPEAQEINQFEDIFNQYQQQQQTKELDSLNQSRSLFNDKLNFKDMGISSKIHQFSVQLDDSTYKYCHVLSFYEQAYIQNIETLAGKRTKIITWSPQIDIQALINNKQVTAIKSALLSNNANISIYVQKSIFVVSNQNETGCEATLINLLINNFQKIQIDHII